MKDFAQLIQALDSSNKTQWKMDAINQYFTEASESDKLWFLALFTGKRPKRAVTTNLLKKWVMEIAEIPEWLFVESYSSVGDLSEAISLLLPEPETYIEKSLSEWMEEILPLKDKTEEEKKEFVLTAWSHLPHNERFIFNKLLGGNFRVGVSSKGLINALAQHYQIDSNTISHALMGDWDREKVNFEDLIRGRYTNTQLSQPYPFCLAYPLEKEPEELGEISDWQIEYKWDGIRSQIIKRDGEVFIWSRGEELITKQFPELVETITTWKGNFVIDGEILPFKNGEVLNFTELQKRLNRKNITKKLKEEVPVVVYAYDLMEYEKEDWREKPMVERRSKLEEIFQLNSSKEFYLSEIIETKDWKKLKSIRENARSINSEGLMLKRKDSPYHTGRKKGDWWKWKIDPLTIDAVLIYAQKGSGRRSGHYTDYTFAVRNGEELVTIAKAYSGLTNEEIKEVSKFVNRNSIEKFGPVRTVKPELVFEISFEGIGFSKRHKSGVALRFPRIARWRKDKTVEEIDELDEIKKLIR